MPEVRTAVIKLVPADAAEATGQLSRWRQAAKLSHPNLIQILDMGRCDLDSTPVLYVVMEFADENLASVIAKRPIAAEEARDIVGPLVDALGYIHGKGFVHGHIKPANIMAEDEQLKISSDGLCRIGDLRAAWGSRVLRFSGSCRRPNFSRRRRLVAGNDVVRSLDATRASLGADQSGGAGAAFNLPPEFLEFARHCLRRDPQLRWSITDIAARLPGSAAAPQNN